LTIEELVAQKIKNKDRKEKETLNKVSRRRLRVIPEVAPEHATCDTCAYNQWNGVNEVKLEWGVCDLWDKTGRLCNKRGTPACRFWRHKAPTKLQTERFYAEKMSGVIADMAVGIKSKGANVKLQQVNRPKELDEDKVARRQSIRDQLLALKDISTEDEESDDE